MATVSFDKEIIIKDKEAAEFIADVLASTETKEQKPTKDIENELMRGKSVLKQFSYRLNKC